MKTEKLTAIVLAGGVGSRLQAVVADLPKPMADIGGRPFLAFLLDYLVDHGVGHVVLSVGYKADIIQSHFGAQHGAARLSYAVEHERLGTGGGLRFAWPLVDSENVLVLNGDTFFAIDPQPLVDQQRRRQAAVTLALRRMDDCARYGRVGVDESGRVLGFYEKQARTPGLINGGVYLINRSWFAALPMPAVFSFERDVLEARRHAAPFFGVAYDDYFIDIGIPEDYARAQRELPARAAAVRRGR